MFRFAGDRIGRGPRTPISTGILGLASVLTAVVLFGSLTGRWRIVPVLSGSMAPTLHAGDLAVVAPQPVPNVKVGDVIVYRIPIGDRHPEIHRVVRVRHDAGGTDVVTAGDANPVPDPWVARLAGPTVWRMSFRIPWLGYVVVLLGRPAVRVACLLLGTALLLAIGLRRIWALPSRGGRRQGAFPTGVVDVGP